MKDSKGRFLKGHKSTKEETIKRITSLSKSWEKRKDYIKDIKNPKIYNSWRSFRFTKKGIKIGNSEEWNDYRNFYNDVIGTYVENYGLFRLDKSKPFSKDNFIWLDKVIGNTLNDSCNKIEYNNEIKTFREWSITLNKSYSSIKNRFYKHKEYTNEEILFGKKKLPKRKIKDISTLSVQGGKNKISKMLSSYKHKDNRKRLEFDLTPEWFKENIINKTCYYCGDDKNIGCDRIDNNKGHLKTNVLPCCVVCNTTRSNNFTVEEMVKIGAVIKEIKLNRE